MNIIGKGIGEAWIVSLSKEELANLQGFYSTYGDGFRADVGVTVPVASIYVDAEAILKQHKEAAEAAKKLRAAGDKFASYFERMDAKTKK